MRIRPEVTASASSRPALALEDSDKLASEIAWAARRRCQTSRSFQLEVLVRQGAVLKALWARAPRKKAE